MASSADPVQASEEPEGIGSNVDKVIFLNMNSGKFDMFPVAGYPGSTSLAACTGINSEHPLNYTDRMTDHILAYSTEVKVKARIFQRIERGNEMTMIMALVTALNDEIDGVSDDELFDKYIEMIDLHKEFVKSGYKARYRPHKEMPFPVEPRVAYGKNITNANDVMTQGKPNLFVGSPASTTTSAQLKTRLKAAEEHAKSSPAASTGTPTRKSASELMPPPRNIFGFEIPPPIPTSSGRSTRRSSRDSKQTEEVGGSSQKRKRASPQAEANKKKREEEAKRKAEEREREKERKEIEKKKKAEQVANAKAQKEKEKLNNKLKRLEERVKKAKDAKLRQKVRDEAKEIMKSLTTEEKEIALEQFSELAHEEVADSVASSHGLSEDIFSDSTLGEPKAGTSGATKSTRKPSQETMRTVSSDNSSDSEHEQPSERRDVDSLGREKSPPGRDAKEKRSGRPARKETQASVDIMNQINNLILQQEGQEQAQQLISREEEIRSAQQKDQESQDSEIVDNPENQPEEPIEEASNSRSSRLLKLVEKLRNEILDFDKAQTHHYKSINNKIEDAIVPQMRTLAANQQTILAQLQSDSDRLNFDAALVKNKVKKLLPLHEDTELTEYFFSSIEVRNMCVDILRDHFRAKKKKDISLNDVCVAFCDKFLSVDWMAHLYWHDKDSKRKVAGNWDRVKVPRYIRDFFEDYCSPIANTTQPPAGKNSRDSKVYKLANARRNYYAWLARDKRNLYHYLKKRYEERVKFYNETTRVKNPNLPEPPTFAEDIRQYIASVPGDLDINNLENEEPPHRVKKTFEVKHGEDFTMDDVDDLVIVLRACGYGDGFLPGDRKRATNALRRIRAQVGKSQEIEDNKDPKKGAPSELVMPETSTQRSDDDDENSDLVIDEDTNN